MKEFKLEGSQFGFVSTQESLTVWAMPIYIQIETGSLKNKDPQDPKTWKKRPLYFRGIQNYDEPDVNATGSWALATRILRLLLASCGLAFKELVSF